MRTQDALNILGLTPNVTAEEIKKAYREACFKFHPDRNSAGLEMMKAVNEAYESLKTYDSANFEYKKEETDTKYGDKFNDALKVAVKLNLTVEICGAWIWVGGDTFSVKEKLKESKFKYARKKSKWYFRPEKYRSRNRCSWDMGKIRDTYGSRIVRTAKEKCVLACT